MALLYPWDTRLPTLTGFSFSHAMTAPDRQKAATKPGLHPRNRHKKGYDFAALTATVPELTRFIVHRQF